MPTYTVAQLEEKLGSYVAPNTEFRACLAQVLPRLYNLGMWRDLVYEISLSGQYGYVALPPDADSIIACTINNNPRPVRSFWHDVRIVGRNPTLSPFFGIVDDGFHPTALDIKDAQEAATDADITDVASLIATFTDSGAEIPFADPCSITVSYAAADAVRDHSVITDVGGYKRVSPGPSTSGFAKIFEIRYEGLPEPVTLADNVTSDVYAYLPAGSGVLRVRRFRISDSGENTTVHLMVKRACPSDLTDDNTVVHLGNIGAIKHALLCLIAEDNADMERAEYHWSKVKELLDEELDAVRGSAKPTFPLDVWGGAPKPYSLY